MTHGYLEEIEAQLIERTGRAGTDPAPERPGREPLPPRHRRRRRPEWLAVVPALVAATAIIAVVIVAASVGGPAATPPARQPASHRHLTVAAHGRSAVRPTASSAPKRSSANPTAPLAERVPASPVPAAFGPTSFTAISEFRWWLLGTSPCSAGACAAEIVHTDDGGRSFYAIPGPPTTHVSQLRFADANDGFAFSPELWVTHDGGASWQQQHLGGTVTGLEAADGYVFAIVRDAQGHGGLERSPVGHDAWTVLPQAGDAFTGLWVYGSAVLLESAASRAQVLAISSDSGAHFAFHPVPPSVACQFEGMPPVIWAACATGTEMGIWRSTDDGAHFAGAGGDASRSGPTLPNSAAFGAAGGAVAVVGARTLYRTGDAGGHYSPNGPASSAQIAWTYLGFTDPTHGVALGSSGTEGPNAQRWLYYTVDAGRSYHRVTIGAG